MRKEKTIVSTYVSAGLVGTGYNITSDKVVDIHKKINFRQDQWDTLWDITRAYLNKKDPQDRAPIHTASDDIINQIDASMGEADIVYEVTWKMINSGVEMKKGDVISTPQISNIDGRYLYNGYKGTIPQEFSIPEFPPRYWSSNPLIPYRYFEGSVILLCLFSLAIQHITSMIHSLTMKNL